jgi:hypothetical protein
MKIKDGFMIREIAGVYIVVPIGERVVDFNGLLTLNETGAFLWKAANDSPNMDNLAESLVNEYDVDINDAKKDVNEFFNVLEVNHIIEG